ncbi:MAG: hypothetical protein V4702_05305 [Patescibacteria group bacterium]
MKDFLLIAAGLVGVISVLPYGRDILRGTTKPNIVSWLTWTLLTGIATAAEIAGHEYRTAIFTGLATINTAGIVLIGLRHGYVRYTRFDVVCQIGAVAGIILWQLFNSPTIGVFAAVLIDCIGTLPTIRHSWLKPHEETWQTYALSGLGGVLLIGALTAYNWVSLLYAVYIVIACAVITTIILARRKQLALNI